MKADMRLAGIDVGTNTVLMLIADLDGAGVLTPVREFHEMPRLGRQVDASRRLGSVGIADVERILKRYASEARAAGCAATRAVATSAMRDAVNGREVAAALSAASGINIEIISGETEARLTYEGIAATGRFGQPFAVLDIGGGSTELIVPNDGLTVLSVNIGSVRITERFFGAGPASVEARRAAEDFIAELIRPFPGSLSGDELVAVSGTPTTLACIDAGETRVPAVDGRRMGARAVDLLADRLLGMTPGEIARLSPVAAGREDILAAGALILSKAMKHVGASEVRVSTAGLRHGVALSARNALTR